MTEKVEEIIFCPKCGAEGNDIIVEEYIPEKTIKKISMDELTDEGDIHLSATTTTNYQLNPTFMRATCGKCGYTVTWKRYTSYYHWSTSGTGTVTDFGCGITYDCGGDCKDANS